MARADSELPGTTGSLNADMFPDETDKTPLQALYLDGLIEYLIMKFACYEESNEFTRSLHTAGRR